MIKSVELVMLNVTIFVLLPIFSYCKPREITQDQSSLNSVDLFPKRDVQRSRILENLDFIYFKGQPKVPTASKDEIDKIKGELVNRRIGNEESRALGRVFGKYSDLLALSLRDSDKDGINDFRVSHFDGKFFEGDLDLDGDGVVNAADVGPFDSNKGGKWKSNQGVPNHLMHPDFQSDTLQGDMQSLRRIQSKLLSDYNVLVVERSIGWDLASLEAFVDVLDHVFKSLISNDGVSTFKTLAAEKQVGIVKEVDGETNAMVVMANKSLIVYESGLRARPLVKLGLMIHELAHSLQYEYDDKSLSQAESNKRQYYFQENFFELMEDFGWESSGRTPDQALIFSAMIPTYELVRPSFSFQGKSAEAWSESIQKWNQSSSSFFTNAPLARKNFLVSDYSLIDPFEWLSENIVAYVFSEMENAVYRLRPGTLKETLQGLIDRELRADWPGYSYREIQGSPYYKSLKDLVPIEDEAAKILAKKYLVPLLDSSGLSLSSEDESRPTTETKKTFRSCGRSKRSL